MKLFALLVSFRSLPLCRGTPCIVRGEKSEILSVSLAWQYRKSFMRASFLVDTKEEYFFPSPEKQ